MPRVVLDVNVLVSALISPHGAPARILREWQAGAFELIVADQLLEELQRVVTRPTIRARIDPQDLAVVLAAVRQDAEVVVDIPEIERVVGGDPSDYYLVALARVGHADVIVTGDRHLLEAEGLGVRVLSPAPFLVGLLAV